MIVNQIDGKNDDNNEEDDCHDEDVILLLDKERRQSYTNIEGICSVRITVLQAFFLCFFIRKAFICLRYEDKLSTGLRIVLVPIGVIQ